MLQEQHPGWIPRRCGHSGDLRGTGCLGEAHGAAVVVAWLDFRGSGITACGERFPQRTGVGRTDPQHRGEAHLHHVGKVVERTLAGQRPEALAEQHQPGPSLRVPSQPAIVDRVDHRPTGFERLLLVDKERDPTRQKGVLHGHQCRVTVVHRFDRPGGHRVHPPSSGGGNYHQDFALIGSGALELREQHRGAALKGAR